VCQGQALCACPFFVGSFRDAAKAAEKVVRRTVWGHQEPVELRSTAQTLRLRSGQASAPGPARSGVQAEFVNGELVRDHAKRRWASFAVASGREL
jgi:hypothetical protein